MKEILGNNLEQFFNTEINGKRTYKGNRYEVWEISDETFNTICDMSEDKFVELAGEDAWWRGAEGSNQGIPDYVFTVNGEKLIAWYDTYRDKDLIEDFENEDEVDKEDGLEQYIATWHTTEFSTLTDYFCSELGASTERNVCALAVDLAKYNNMTIGELFAKYEG